MTIPEIEALASEQERIAAYRRYLEANPNHPIAWFNLAVDLEHAREYGGATEAARRVRALSVDLYVRLPRRVRELAKEAGDVLDDTPIRREVGDYRILGITAASESHFLYDAVRVSDGTPVTLRRVLDLSHEHARAQFTAAKAAPEGAGRTLAVVADDDGAPLQVLARVRGAPLPDLVKAGALDLDVAVRVVRAAALGCGTLHAAGAIHGDLRADHVVRDDRDAGDERVVLLGARMTPGAPTPRGRFPSRSPEEDAGEPVDARTDVYGLGLLLHLLASGSAAPSLAERNAGTISTVEDDAVDAVVRRCLARDPAKRFQTVEELASALDDLLVRRALPEQIGKWKLGDKLGEGSFGRVYAAENVDVAGLRAAVKILDPYLARSRDMRRRFLAEATASGKADHPGIVKIFDGGTAPDGTTYLAMELLEGRSLEAEVQAAPLSPARSAALGAQVAGALAAAHGAGIVHRDLKPGNLVVVARGGREVVKVLDFGVALLRGPTREGGSFTLTGRPVGSPAYIAPEVWQSAPDVDGRADIYSLGCVLFECVAGRPPFTASTHFEWQTAHLEKTPPGLRSLAPTCPPRLAALVARMLAKKREDRPATMAEVAEELEAIAREQPGEEERRRAPRPWWPWALGGALAVGAAIAIAIAAGGGSSGGGGTSPADARAAAIDAARPPDAAPPPPPDAAPPPPPPDAAPRPDDGCGGRREECLERCATVARPKCLLLCCGFDRDILDRIPDLEERIRLRKPIPRDFP